MIVVFHSWLCIWETYPLEVNIPTIPNFKINNSEHLYNVFWSGINLFGFASIEDLFEGLGLLIMALGIGIITADYVYPNTGEEITKA